jgi:hypothetical protein
MQLRMARLPLPDLLSILLKFALKTKEYEAAINDVATANSVQPFWVGSASTPLTMFEEELYEFILLLDAAISSPPPDEAILKDLTTDIARWFATWLDSVSASASEADGRGPSHLLRDLVTYGKPKELYKSAAGNARRTVTQALSKPGS